MKSIIFIAPPAAGKGTQAAMITSKYGIPHVSIGGLLRKEVSKQGKHSDYIKEQMLLGKLVKDDIILDLIRQRISQSDCNNGYILDGFPRDIEQADAYRQLLEELDKDLGIVIVLEIEKENAMKRMVGRLTCPKCGLIYNDLFEITKPKEKGFCDICHVALSKRADDNKETFNKRYQTYISLTEPLINYYKEKTTLYYVNSGISREYTFNQIEIILKKEGFTNDKH